MHKESEEAAERRLASEASKRCLGTLGDRDGVNVAKVEVLWYIEEPSDDGWTNTCYEAGHYFVHAVGGDIYKVFETLVAQAMDAKEESGRIHGWEISDISAA